MKSRQKKSSVSLFVRLFGGGKKKTKRPVGKKGKEVSRKAKAVSPPEPQARPLTPRERSIREICQMARIGQKDPERLARLLATLLAKERERRQADKERFEQQIWEILHRSREQESSPPSPPPDA